MKRIYNSLLLILTFGLVYLGHTLPVNADSLSGKIIVTPSTGSYTTTQVFTLKVKAESATQDFTTFGATVNLTNLTVVSFTKGSEVTNCTTTPTKDSLSFFCGVTGSTRSVDVYTLTVKGTSTGSAGINVTNCSIKATDGVSVNEICVEGTGSAFTITAPASGVVTNPTLPPPASSTSTSTNPEPVKIAVKIEDENGKALTNIQVNIDKETFTSDGNGQIYLDKDLSTNSKVVIRYGNKEIEGKVLSGNIVSFTLTDTFLIFASVQDESGNPLPNTFVSINGAEYVSDTQGQILLNTNLNKNSLVRIVFQGKNLVGKVVSGDVVVYSTLPTSSDTVSVSSGKEQQQSTLIYAGLLALVLIGIIATIVLLSKRKKNVK